MEKDRGAAAGTADPSLDGAAAGPVSANTAGRSATANAARPPTSRKRKRTATTKTQLSTTVKTRGTEWSVASICGGRYKAKTVFSADERCLLVAIDNALKVVNVQTGQIIRSIRSRSQLTSIADFAIDPSNEFRVLVAYSSPRIEVYDWTDGLLITHCDAPARPLKLTGAGKHSLFLLTASDLSLLCFPLPSNSIHPSTESRPKAHKILSWKPSGKYLPCIAADISSNTICVAVATSVWVARNFVESPLSPVISMQQYSVPHPATTLACFRDMLAVGEASGCIRIYSHLDGENRLRETSVINWHNSAVSSLQIVSHGAYLLSCASEDALMLSQIATGRKQFVPRLGAAIIAVSLSHSGSYYALSMGNNTIKILDAADFRLISELSGALLPAHQPSASVRKSRPKSVALLQPSSDRLYITGVEGFGGIVQGYDLLHDQQKLRFNVTPLSQIQTSAVNKRPVHQVDAKFAAFTHDGHWLATVDEWHDHESLDDSDIAETNLKFWHLSGREWIMTTKVESPHGVLCRVLGLASPGFSGASLEFTTLGDDGQLKIWRSSGELHGDSSATWVLFRTIGSHSATHLSEGSIIYSPDGTVLLAHVGSCAYVISQSNGNVLKRLDIGRSISRIDMLERYVLTLHSQPPALSCLDVATGHVLFSERFDSTTSTLAVNASLSSFAVSTSSEQPRSVITISRISQGVRIDEAQIYLNSRVAVLLGANLSLISGFVYVDESGQIGCIATRRSGVVGKRESSGSEFIDHKSAISTSAHVEKRGILSWPAKEDSMNTVLGVLEREGDINLARILQDIVQCI